MPNYEITEGWQDIQHTQLCKSETTEQCEERLVIIRITIFLCDLLKSMKKGGPAERSCSSLVCVMYKPNMKDQTTLRISLIQQNGNKPQNFSNSVK